MSVGRERTVEEHYYNWRKDIVDGGVRDIINTVVDAMLIDGRRTFTFDELKYFQMWWDE